jgi:hypothetical protein
VESELTDAQKGLLAVMGVAALPVVWLMLGFDDCKVVLLSYRAWPGCFAGLITLPIVDICLALFLFCFVGLFFTGNKPTTVVELDEKVDDALRRLRENRKKGQTP